MALVFPPKKTDPTFDDWMHRFYRAVFNTEGEVTQDHAQLSNLNSDNYSHVTSSQAGQLTGGTNTTLHFHASDRNRANHTGTQTASTISDFAAAVQALLTAGTWTELEVNFGTTPVYDAQFTITDAAISNTSKVIVVPSGKTATGRADGDWQWDGATFAAKAGSGSAICYAVFHPGPIVGRRYIQYQVA